MNDILTLWIPKMCVPVDDDDVLLRNVMYAIMDDNSILGLIVVHRSNEMEQHHNNQVWCEFAIHQQCQNRVKHTISKCVLDEHNGLDVCDLNDNVDLFESICASKVEFDKKLIHQVQFWRFDLDVYFQSDNKARHTFTGTGGSSRKPLTIYKPRRICLSTLEQLRIISIMLQNVSLIAMVNPIILTVMDVKKYLFMMCQFVNWVQ